ncbi:DNA-formamidopyrimidine glycosylase [Spirulina sp. CS-785/01]|uniref:DNA-formamidopyrimidine glycosylase n=1 Tax=Spirulina sp. CS-785/01 TaxID=3021716 RepID=UPI00232C8C48|nr:DNA-formamidopyrimidine glycosylase [Spirulina sp. CS-785/01]MDB9315218.1 DNA-formamidopyrimidine glycosylase [Spirulina sp. CS-785/01]
MPELPEVETVCRGLNQLTRHSLIQGGEVLLERTLAYPGSVSAFLAGVTGKSIAAWHRRGKYLLAQLSPGGWLGVHLRMTGQLAWVEPEHPLSKHTRLRLFLETGELRFVDIRTFGKVWYVPPEQDVEAIITGLQGLGVEPLSEEFTVDYLGAKLGKTRRVLKTALLDQAVVAGLGNIYADEALFASQLPPDQIAMNLSSAEIKRLHGAIIAVLEQAIGKGGTTFSDFLDLLGVPGNYGDAATVYGRTGQPCRVCGTAIQRRKIAGRSAHFCPQCQISNQ